MSRRNKVAVLIWLFVFFITIFPGVKSPASRAQGQTDELQNKLPRVPGRLLVKFRPQTLSPTGRQAHDLIAEAGARPADEITPLGVQVLELPEGADEEAFARAFRSQAEVEFAEPDYLVPLAVTPNDPDYAAEWHLPRISAPNAWDRTTGSGNVIIAVLDSGVDASHSDLASKLVPGWNIYNNNADTTDVTGHGTAVAGVAAAASNNRLGVASVAWNCLIMPVRVAAPEGWATTSALANGLIWAADHGARVANMSFAYINSSTLNNGARYMRGRGGVVIMAAGNSASFSTAPDNPDIITVSATDPADLLASFSNRGNYIDMAAPGVGIRTTNRGGGYGSWNGTSFAAPITAGLAGLVLSANPGLGPDEVEDILEQSGDDLGDAGWDANFGWGRLNAERAVNLAGGQTPPDTTPPTISLTMPAPVRAASGTIYVEVTAEDNVGVTDVTLSVDGTLIGGDFTAPYTFAWDTTTVADGAHTLTATAQDAAGNTASATVTVTVDNTPAPAPPTITITSPANGARVNNTVAVYVNTTGDARITRVELYVDGALKAVSAVAPFTTKWNARRAPAGAHRLQCFAYDEAGNVAASPVVTVYR